MGAAGHADPLRRSLTGGATALLAGLLLAAAVYFGASALQSSTDPRPALAAALDELVLPAGVVHVADHPLGTGVTCMEEAGCPGVERWWVAAAEPAALCPDVQTAVGEWGAVRLQRLGSAPCAFLGVHGAQRLTFSVEPTGAETAAMAPDARSLVRVALTGR